jgi:dihydropteroate synthase
MTTVRLWEIGSDRWKLGRFPRLMGIVNVTPDSFSDGGQFSDVSVAVEHALRLADEGADILDIGGESTRPGATPVSLDEELRRVVPVVRELARQTRLPISIDTYKAEVARLCLDAGALIVNDISGLTFDPAMISVCRESTCGVIVMHIQGTPQTMQLDPRYDDVVEEVRQHFSRRLDELEIAGIARERIVLDPGIGFGKTAEHNLDLLSHIAAFHELGRPVLIGHSRKRFLQKVLGRDIEERNAGTIGVSLALAAQGTDILRVHDVRATHDALLAWQTVISHSHP